MRLYEELKDYCASDSYPFHMPGHKRRLGAVDKARSIDITEIDGFDNLHHAQGILREAQQRAAGLYGSEDTFYLINGSTCGLLAAVFACTAQGGKLLMARNCHKAVYHAAELRELETVYLYPGAPDGPDGLSGSIRPEDVRAALDAHKGIQAVLITSPTYEGVVSDVGTIAGIAHEHGLPLIVDEAHGAHFGFHPYFPENSVRLGADLVIHSLHKTLPSLTQTALLHRNGTLVMAERVKKYLDIFETSSPSYVLMAGMDECIRLLETRGTELFSAFAGRLQKFELEMVKLRHIRLLEPGGKAFAKDPSKLILQAEGHSGKWLEDVLREHAHLELEMAAGAYAVALTSLADTDEGFGRLLEALRRMDALLERETAGGNWQPPGMRAQEMPDPKPIKISDAAALPRRKVPLAKSAGQTSAEYVYLYPPGIPLLVPGEHISEGLIGQLCAFRAAGYSLQGMDDNSGREIAVVY